MNAEEIRAVDYADIEKEKGEGWRGFDKAAIAFFLREIAAQLAELNLSVRWVRDPSQWECGKCFARFDSQDDYLRHLDLHHV